MDNASKTIRVVAAVICDYLENPTEIFATARGHGEFKGQWEFPGGKIEVGETPQQALIREIKEELSVKIKVGKLIDTIEYDYPTFHLSMDCFWCVVVDGEIILKEAEDARWLCKDKLYSVNWLPADITLIKKIQNSLLSRESEIDIVGSRDG
ncbi:MAG TPA: 8-oxo-dGTP diphosphatase MutT [Lachnospiraceae bacterium]|jgi:8-oxo-dGTP diphosphatase|nr:8-oxo-dGTP diphosphatase MutT [Lachnospiraceae bacterium]